MRSGAVKRGGKCYWYVCTSRKGGRGERYKRNADGSIPFIRPTADGVKPKEPTAYVMVYHKDADHSLHMAVSDDLYNWRAVDGDRPVVKGDDIARALEQHYAK